MRLVRFVNGTNTVTPTCTNQSHSCGGGRYVL